MPPAFNSVAAELRGYGWNCLNPIEEDAKRNHRPQDCVMKKNGVAGDKRGEALKADCIYICEKKPCIFVLPFWQQSSGSKAELALAKSLGLKIKYIRRKKVAEIIRRRSAKS
jgi:hypothetical protein